ncbi:hypothetical protein AB1N83_012480 [Pleurotus pulmonarius]
MGTMAKCSRQGAAVICQQHNNEARESMGRLGKVPLTEERIEETAELQACTAISRSTTTTSNEDPRRSGEGDEAQTRRAEARLGTCADGVKARTQYGRSTLTTSSWPLDD